MISPDRIWHRVPGASSEALIALQEAAGIELPQLYLDLLRYSNGGEGPIAKSPYNLCLESAEDAAKLKIERTYDEFFPGFFVFGSSGGGEYIAFDARGGNPWPIVSIDMTNINLSESVETVATEFSVFLQLIGASL